MADYVPGTEEKDPKKVIMSLQQMARTLAAATAATGAASTTASGIIELATDAETRTGTDTARAITPANHVASHGPRFQARRTTSQTPTGDAWIKVQVNTEDLDLDGVYDNATNYRFTPGISGYYFVWGLLSLSVDAGMGVAIYKNGSAEIYQYHESTATHTAILNVGGVVFLDADDYVELFGYSSHPTPAFNSASFGAFRVGP